MLDPSQLDTKIGDEGWKQVLGSFYALADEKLRHFRGVKLDWG